MGPGDRLFDEGELDRLATDSALSSLRWLSDLAHEWGMELSQLALAFTLTLPGMGPVIPSASSVTQLESNAAAGKIQLSEEQRTRVKSVLER